MYCNETLSVMTLLPTIHLESLIFYYTTQIYSSAYLAMWVGLKSQERHWDVGADSHTQVCCSLASPVVHDRTELCGRTAEKMRVDRIKWFLKGSQVYVHIKFKRIIILIYMLPSCANFAEVKKIRSHYCQDAAFHAKLILMITLALSWSQKAIPLCLWSQFLIACL